MQTSVFVQNSKRKKKLEIFVFCILTFEPIIAKTCEAPQNDCYNLSFVHGQKMARECHKKSFIKSLSFQNGL